MRESILHWFKLYEDEITIFLWTAAILFLIRSSGMILNNYAETTFLKRYGIEYLPVVNMINTVATFVITGVLTTFMARFSGARILFFLFLFCGFSTTLIRLVIPYGIELVYPLLFMLKSQYELLQALLFWNLANDLFNTRQSKRIFPLLTAGGVLGLIAGSFSTPYLAELFQFDNLLLVYMATTLAGAAVIVGMGRRFPSLMRDVKKSVKGRTPMAEELKRVWPLLKQSSLFKIVLVLTFMPNVVIPIMNYQFNYTVDQFYPTETGMIVFFSYFRGVLNILSLFILLFIGRLYGRFGIPMALLFHPLNYTAAFLAFFFRFDIFSAIYARMSTNIIRTTINLPTTSILIGLFPESYRAMVRPFLRGTVVRAGLLLGSSLILVVINFFHPRYLSLVALPFVLVWIGAPIVLKRNYASILKSLIAGNRLDIRALEEENTGKLFRGQSAGDDLVKAFLSSKGDDAIWYARLLKSLDTANIDQLILQVLENQDDKTRLKLIELLSGKPDGEMVRVLEKFLDGANPGLSVAVLKTLTRAGTDGDYIKETLERIGSFMDDPDPKVRGYAAGYLCLRNPAAICETIDQWLGSPKIAMRKSGIIGAGLTGKRDYAAKLESLIRESENEALYPDILHALANLGSEKLNDFAMSLLDHDRADVRSAALSVIEITDDASLKKIISHLGDPQEHIREAAKNKIKGAEHINGQVLIESLSRPNKNLRENIFNLLEILGIKNLDLFRFTREGFQQCYISLSKAEAIGHLPENTGRRLLFEHLLEKKDLILENIFRILAIHDRDGQMRVVHRGLFSKDARVKGNAVELLGDIMDRGTFGMVQPLLESFSLHRTLEEGKKHFRVPVYNPDGDNLISSLLSSTDWIEVVLTVNMIYQNLVAGEKEAAARYMETIEMLCSSPAPQVCRAAGKLYAGMEGVDAKEKTMDTHLTISDKILLLKNIAIFSDLTVSELGAIAAVTEETDYEENQTVFQEGDPGDNVYLIIDGEVAVYKGCDSEKEVILDTMGKGDYFGEMALFEETGRSATIRTNMPSRFMVLHKQDFNELVREYPRIALQICTVFSHRLRNLQSKLTDAECHLSS